MANLGSDSTPISGESFDLPSGWSFEENSDGEVVITDSGGTTIGRRDETNGEWVFDSIVGDTLEAGDTLTDASGTDHTGELADTNHGNEDENYTLQIDGVTVADGDTINFKTE